MTTTVRQRIQAITGDTSVTPLELFFDLVFVYALTQVTGLMSSNVSGRGLLQGMIVLVLVWWCWVGYSWLGNSVKADEGAARAAFIAVMATVFVMALAIPESFDDFPGGVSGPMTFAVCYGIVRLIHLGFYVYAARDAHDSGLLHQLARFGAVTALSMGLMIAGALTSGDRQIALWLIAISVDYVGTQVIGAGGWRLYAPGHFAERHGLIIIIALGESIVAIGVGASQLAVAWPLIAGAILGIMLIAALWWVYFDVTALAVERRLAAAVDATRTALGRDAYSYLHLPMIAGVVVTALGLKKTLEYIGGEGDHDWTDSLHGIPLAAMHAGPALFLIALVLMRLRVVRSFSRSRSIAAVVLLATIPLGEHIGTLGDLALVTGILAALVAFEAVRYAETRHRIRHLENPHSTGHDGHEPPDA